MTIQTKRVGDRLAFRVGYEDSPQNPRTDRTEIAGWHDRYDLGGEYARYSGREEFEESVEPDHILRPLYMYNHSAIVLSTSPFSSPWDSGRVGYVRVTPESAENFGGDIADAEQVKRIVNQEVQALSDYINGNVFCVSAHRAAHGDVPPTPLLTFGDIWSTEDRDFDDAAVEMLDHIPTDTSEGVTADAVLNGRWQAV